MAKQEVLLDAQKALLDGMAAGKRVRNLLNEYAISLETLAEWMDDPWFIQALSFRQELMRMDTEFLLIRCSYDAVQTLIDLMNAGEGELQRKVCLDIMKMAGKAEPKKTAHKRKQPFIDEEKARRVLLAAARRHQ